MHKIKGFLFDMDGVVVDNHHFHFKAWMEFAHQYNFYLDEQIYRDQYNGKTNRDLFEMIFKNPSVEEMKKYAEEKEGMYQKIYLPHMKAHKGLLDFLDYLRAHKYKIALGTSAPTSNVDFVLDHLSLRKYFDVIVDGPQVSKGKPHPEVYQLCAYRLNLKPEECVVFEDSLAGLEAGKRAGCEIVGVATSHTKAELQGSVEKIIFDFTEARSILKLA
ncbi:MAG: HAD family hydrolase [Bacteriovoracaceae bacterium]